MAGGEGLLQDSGAGKTVKDVKRKDSGLSVHSLGFEKEAHTPKARDFALEERKLNEHATMKTSNNVAGAAVTIKAGKAGKGVWRRIRVTLSKVGGKA